MAATIAMRGQGGNTDDVTALPQPLPHTERQADPIRLPPPGAGGAESGNRRARCRRC